MMNTISKEYPGADNLAYSARHELGLDKVVAVGLENGFVGFGGVHDQHLSVSEVEVADEGCLGPFVAPPDLEIVSGRGFEYSQELPEEWEVVLDVGRVSFRELLSGVLRRGWITNLWAWEVSER